MICVEGLGGWVSSASFLDSQTRAHTHAHTDTRTHRSPLQWGWYIYSWWVMTVLQLIPERNLACFWCSTALIYSNSRKKKQNKIKTNQGAKPDAEPHCIPGNLLTVNTASVLKVYWLQSPHFEPNIKNSSRVSLPQRHVYYLPRDTAARRYSFSVIAVLCPFFYIYATEGHSQPQRQNEKMYNTGYT